MTTAALSRLAEEGIGAALAGDNGKARQLLLRSVAEEPGNESVWLWLAGVAATPGQAAEALEMVLALNPTNERALSGLREARRQAGGAVEVVPEAPPAWACPVCEAADALAHAVCPWCGCLTTLRPPAAFARHRPSDPDAVTAAVDRLLTLPESATGYETYWRLAVALLNQQRFAEAMEELQTALTFRPESDELPRYIYSLRGHAESEQSRERRALDAGPAVLLVDDSATVRKVVTAALQAAGYRALVAANAAEALRAVRESGAPALFVIDADLPGTDGTTLCKTLRQSPDTAKVPVVMLTARGGLFERLRARAAGASHAITKPFDPAVLLEAVRSHVAPAQ